MLLCDCEVNITHQYISLWVLEVSFLKIAADVIISDLRIVKFICASLGFVKGKELKEAISVLALGLLVHVDDCLEHIEAELLYMLV